MNIEVFDSVESCSARRDDWNAFAGECGSDVSLTYEWHLALERSQEAQGAVRTVWMTQDGRVSGILPLRADRIRLGGVPLKQLSPLGASYSAHDCLLVRSASLEVLDGVLRAAGHVLPRWDVFGFSVSEDSAAFSQVEDPAGQDRPWVEWSEAKGSPYLTLPGNLDDFERDMGSKRRTDLRARLRKVSARGEPRLRVITRPEEVAEAMEIVKSIERASWKEPAGTSITANPYQVVFYDVLTHELARRGWLRLYLLLLDGQPVAHDIGFAYKGRFYSGKTSFVETLRTLHVGFVLRWFIVVDLYGHGIREHDFMGDPDRYKLHWTDTVRRHRNVRLLRRGARTHLARWLRSWRRKPNAPALEGA